MTDKKEKNVFERLLEVQKKAKAPREISSKFGKARSAEQILAAYKPVCNENGLYLSTSDAIVHIGERNYITATATVTNVNNPDETYSASASAWEGGVPVSNRGQEILDTSQVSGKTSSYAKKYALQNLFGIDDTHDADRDTEEVTYNSVPEAQRLAKAKSDLFKELESLGYDTAASKQLFVNSVLKKDTIDTLDEAYDVGDAIDNEREREIR